MSSGTNEGNMSSVNRAALASSAMTHWSKSLVSVIESMTAHRSKIESRVSPSSSLAEGFSWWGQSLSVLEQPSFWIGASPESWADLGRLTLSALGVEKPTDTEIAATCRDLMTQTCATVGIELTRQFGEEITGGGSIPASQPNADEALVCTWSLDAGRVSIQGAAVWAGAFLRHFSGSTPQPAEANGGSEQSTHLPAGEPPLFGGRSVDSIPKLDLRVNFILGRATLPLRDIFKLNVGSVIELDRMAIEPADVVIHGRVLACGQVVVVNGNYGLKILPRQQ
jgi:flagellar motor switch protein FliN/FliY